jgi:hypothetical protein
MARFKFGRSVRCAPLALVSVLACAVPAPTRSTHVEGSLTDLSGAVRAEASETAGLRAHLSVVADRVKNSTSAYAAAGSPTVFYEWCVVVRAAGVSGDASLAPLLRTIAEQAADSDSATLSLEAMDSLYRLGEGIEYFRIRANDLSRGVRLARNAMLICAREPDAGRADAFEEVAERASRERVPNAAFLASAAHEARFVIQLEARLASFDTLGQKIALLASHSIGGFNVFVSTEFILEREAPDHRSRPSVVWSRGQIVKLATQSPVEAAEALLVTKFEGMLDDAEIESAEQVERLLYRYRDHVSQFLPPASLAIYLQHRPPPDEHKR